MNMKSVYPGFLLALLGLSAVPVVQAGADGTAANPSSGEFREITLPDAHEQVMHSRSGREYRILVSSPAAPAPPNGWPVVYVLDGNGWFTQFSQQARLKGGKRPDKTGVLPAVVVGIGYPGGRAFDRDRRNWDFTPPAALREPNPKQWGATGGADELVSFLVDEVKPEIQRQFKVDTHREILFGHSLGGLFTLHAFFKHPQSFDDYVAASPSVWWNKQYVVRESEEFAAGLGAEPMGQRLLITMGADELPYMVADPKALWEQLAPVREKGVEIMLRELAEEDHLSAAPTAFSRLMKYFLKPTESDLAYYKATRESDAAEAAP